ncbi:hypothetical protein ACHAXT_000528 [Thalassiosira profunda]
MSTAASVRTASGVGRRLLSQPRPLHEAIAAAACTSRAQGALDAFASSAPIGNASTSATTHHARAISSMGRPPISPPSPSPAAPPTFATLRNKVTMPFEAPKGGQPYASPYAEFFANVDAGRSSLGTTEEMERRACEIKEQHLDCGIPESALRFVTASYGRFALPPYVAPGEHRVTVKVSLDAIPFESEQEREVFLQIVGSRYNPQKGDLQLSSEKFASRIENKRYLVDMIERIVASARKLASDFAAEDGKAGPAATS